MGTAIFPAKRCVMDWLRIGIHAAWASLAIAQACPTAAAETMYAGNVPVRFDIAAQPLVSALNAYTAVMHMELFYDGALVTGRQSSAVQGTFAPSDALRKLLEGTGLVALLSDSETITISVPDTPSAEELAAVKSRSVGYGPYLARIQSSVRDALCGFIITDSEASDLLIRFRITPSGAVANAEFFTVAGSDVHLPAYDEVMRTLDIGEPPPPRMPQPVTMMILARSLPRGAWCSHRQATVR